MAEQLSDEVQKILEELKKVKEAQIIIVHEDMLEKEIELLNGLLKKI